MAQKKNSEQSIQISIGKKDYIYLAIVFIVITIAVCVSIFVPRYYKQKYSQMQQTTSTSSASNKSVIATGTTCNTSKTICLIKDLNSFYHKYSMLIASDGNLKPEYTLKNGFTSVEELAQQILPQLTALKADGNLTESVIMQDDTLLYNLDAFCTLLNDMMYVN